MTLHLTPEQHKLLLTKIHKNRVAQRDGQSYVEAHDDKAHLIRIFGFGGFDSEVVEQSLIFEEKTTTSKGKDAWSVAYRSVVKLTVYDQCGCSATYTEGHVGDSIHPQRGEAHGNAVANSESYALKRCCVFLGDQYGLSLYNKGQQEGIVRWTLVTPPAPKDTDKPSDTPNTDDIPQVHSESLELPEAGPDPRTTSTATPPTPATLAPEPAAGGAPPSSPPAAEPSKAAEIRALAVGEPPTEYQGKPAKWIAHLMGLAVKSGDLQTPVESLTSPTLVPLKLLLEEALKFATAPATPQERSA